MPIKWDLFRGRLRQALEAAHMLPDDIPDFTPDETNVLRAYLAKDTKSLPIGYKKRDDLPEGYIGRLYAVDGLDLETYLSRSAIGEDSQPSRTQVAGKAKKQRLTPSDYVDLECQNPQALREAFRDRIQNARMDPIHLARRYHFFPSSKDVIARFLDASKPGIVFELKLQEQFWAICKFLNEESPNPMPNTEAFIVKLFEEGTVQDAKLAIDKLKTLHEYAMSQGATQAK